MKTEELTTIEHLSNFLEGTQAVAFTISSDKDKRYRWLQRELVRFDYLSLNKPDKGIVIRYLLKVTGYFYFVIFPHPSADRILWQPVVAGVALE